MRLIDADELKKKSSKMMFEKATWFGSFDVVGVLDIDAVPTIDPEALRPTAHWIKCDLVKFEHGEYTRHRDAGISCSKCKNVYDKFALWDRKFCPGCGSRMIDCEDGEHR